MQAFNKNFIVSGVTKIVTWYLVGFALPDRAAPRNAAASSWRTNRGAAITHARKVLWAYAHYGQFSQIGWQYLNGACGNLAGGGTFVTLKSPGADYSIIAETKGASAAQKVTFNISGGLSTASSASGAAMNASNS